MGVFVSRVLKGMRVNRVGWAVVFMAAVTMGVAGCGGDGAGRDVSGVSSTPSAPVTARPEDSGPITKAKMRLVLDGVTRDVGAPPSDPEAVSMPESSEYPLAGCAVTYKGFDTAASTLDVERTNALAAALTGRGWTEANQRNERKAPDGTVDVVEAVFKKRGWTVVMEYRLFSDNRTLSLNAYDDACVKKVRVSEDATPSN
ncbi:hypothetical protein ABZ621_36425 [Streptomyces sp. NPDC007863]|uniref:hypothetical protein n=1 Tax=Streptomyces sp. NPDC007863 TaxID=3154894 RepID=UPI0033EF5A90